MEDPLLRREKFAVSLRRQKKREILCSKRKKNFEAISQSRVANGMGTDKTEQVAYEVPAHLNSEAGIINAILSLEAMVGNPQARPQLLETLRGLRLVTVDPCAANSTAFQTLLTHPASL